MRNLFLIPVILLLSACSCVAAGNFKAEWERGDSFYEQKQYDSAAACFEQIAAMKPRNAEVYFNLGNTYYRLNKVAMAILNYERALKLNPEYKEAKENLLLAQGRISNAIQPTHDIFFVNWWHDVTRADKATAWDVTALVIFTCIFVLLLLKRLKIISFIPPQVTGLLFFVFVCFLALAFFATVNIASHSAVVMQGDAPLMNADLKGKPLVLLPEGTTVKIKSESGLWAEVTLPDGRTGWLQESLIDKI